MILYNNHIIINTFMMNINDLFHTLKENQTILDIVSRWSIYT